MTLSLIQRNKGVTLTFSLIQRNKGTVAAVSIFVDVVPLFHLGSTRKTEQPTVAALHALLATRVALPKN